MPDEADQNSPWPDCDRQQTMPHGEMDGKKCPGQQQRKSEAGTDLPDSFLDAFYFYDVICREGREQFPERSSLRYSL